MKSPFPGMDPYLEARWSDVHVTLIGLIKETLQPQLPTSLRARSQERVLVEHEGGEEHPIQRYEPDVAVVDSGLRSVFRGSAAVASVKTLEPVIVDFEDAPQFDRYIHIVDTTNGNRVVTAIEVLSHWNKAGGKLNKQYLKKLHDYERAEVSVVEIDLLRTGRGRLPVGQEDLDPERRTPYLACIRKGWEYGRWYLYPISLRLPLPKIPIPLRQADAEVVLDLQPLIERCYVAGGHDDIDYTEQPDPPLSKTDASWAAEVVLHVQRPAGA